MIDLGQQPSNRLPPQVWLPSPSWANHNAIFSAVGMEVGAYAYYDKATCGFDFEGAKADIKVSKGASIKQFHTGDRGCANFDMRLRLL